MTDSAEQKLAYVYFEGRAKLITKDGARRIAAFLLLSLL
jgi:hypothetical protein